MQQPGTDAAYTLCRGLLDLNWVQGNQTHLLVVAHASAF
jgi:hypothetical protein